MVLEVGEWNYILIRSRGDWGGDSLVVFVCDVVIRMRGELKFGWLG